MRMYAKMFSSFHLVIILAMLFGHLQFRVLVVARVSGPVQRRANATIFTPARTHNGAYNNLAFGPEIKTYTRTMVAPNWIVPTNNQSAFKTPGFSSSPQNRTWFPTNHGFYGATSGSASNGWIASNNSQPEAFPSGWFQPNVRQGQIDTPALLSGRSNGTFYPAYNQTSNSVPQGGRTVHGNSYSSPYGNLSV
ncbi:uncharacterized protein LOC128259529 [Drosophila gunungcola]|uniref:uncharacterized protein LOC128259529 n=1 Tax=Drosophila gunungcola TaxID=103775 RepID=UPI0022E5E0DB|nr:uncharacterized protein LOC128259529 [Drosophila gunungcola]